VLLICFFDAIMNIFIGDGRWRILERIATELFEVLGVHPGAVHVHNLRLI
jgi:hypothetical protein